MLIKHAVATYVCLLSAAVPRWNSRSVEGHITLSGCIAPGSVFPGHASLNNLPQQESQKGYCNDESETDEERDTHSCKVRRKALSPKCPQKSQSCVGRYITLSVTTGTSQALLHAVLCTLEYRHHFIPTHFPMVTTHVGPGYPLTPHTPHRGHNSPWGVFSLYAWENIHGESTKQPALFTTIRGRKAKKGKADT